MRARVLVTVPALCTIQLASACTYDFDQFADTAGGRGSTTGAGGTTSIGTAGQPTTYAEITGGRTSSGGTSSMGTTTSCAGVPYQSICWYLGSAASSCQQVCASHGQTASNAASFVGTVAQGGNVTECAAILSLLGVAQAPTSGTRTDGTGLGCHVFSGQPWWLSSPAFSTSASNMNARIACGCTR
jgi:hypothetical protein